VGSKLKYIADSALYRCGGDVCHHCESEDKPIYSYFGKVINPNKAKNVQLALEEPDMDELCVDCINSGNVKRRDYYEFEKTIELYAKDNEYSLREINLLPDIPLFLQGADWPMCCGEWCEFQGCPESYDQSVHFPKKYKYWEQGPKGWDADYELMPESLREISLFKCSCCQEEYFTWQFT